VSIFRGKHGPLLIAEIGGNHEGDFDYAVELTNLAIETNVDYVKYQLYTGDHLVNPVISPDRNKHFKKFELGGDQYIALAQMVQKAGIGFMASVWDVDFFDWIDPYLDIYKVGSGDLTAYSILKGIADRGKPIILSTGLSSESEVLDAVRFLQEVDTRYSRPENLAILQCTSMYPIDNRDAHLNVMGRLKSLTGLTIGYSDHTIGTKALSYAVAKGAEILEFHFTDRREGKQFRDHKVSLMPIEVLQLQQEIRLINDFLGDERKNPVQIELDNEHRISFRRAVYPVRDIPKGTIIREDDLIVLRPNVGIDARYFYQLIGKKAKRDLGQWQKLEMEYFE